VCGIALVNKTLPGDDSKSISNIAQVSCLSLFSFQLPPHARTQIVVSGLSFFLVVALFFLAGRRRAAVGRIEIRFFLALYALSLPLQILSTGAVLQQVRHPHTTSWKKEKENITDATT
jgi:hypothetical protein